MSERNWDVYWNHLDALKLAFETVRQERDEALARIASLRAVNAELLAACYSAMYWLDNNSYVSECVPADAADEYYELMTVLRAAIARAKETDNG